MRTPSVADALFPEIRKRLLAALLMNPSRSWYASDLARHVETPKTSLQRELANLHRAGIVLRRVEGKHVYYRANPECPCFPELRGLMAKTAGLVDVLRDVLAPLASRIDLALVYGSIARGEEEPTSDVDLLVVGEVGLADLAEPLRRASELLARSVNPTVISMSELRAKLRHKEGFFPTVLRQPVLPVLGDGHELDETPGGTAGRGPGADKGGDRWPSRPGGKGPRGRDA